MSFLELFLAVLRNVKYLFGFVGVVFILAAILTFIHSNIEYMFDSDKQAKGYKTAKKGALLAIICGAIVCVPDVNNLLAVRIGLLKYELAAPENVKNTTETIERIGKKLECKYLGCAEEKK